MDNTVYKTLERSSKGLTTRGFKVIIFLLMQCESLKATPELTFRHWEQRTRAQEQHATLTWEGSHNHRVAKAHRQNYGVNYSLFPPSINRTVQKLLKKTTSYTNYILYQKLDLRYTNSLLLYTPSTQISSNFGCPIQSIRHPKSSPREVATVNDGLCCCCSCSSCC